MVDEHPKACTTCDIELAVIDERKLVTDVLGYWPCFHDAVLESLHLDQSQSGSGADIRAEFRVHKMLSELDDRGYYRLVDHTRIAFLFENAYLQSLSMDMFPDVVTDIVIKRRNEAGDNPPVEVRLVTTGVSDFTCQVAKMVDVQRVADASEEAV
jgi:hypothetical protein